MCIYVQNLSLSALGAETGLTGNTISLTDVPDIQIGLTDTSTGLTGPADPSNSVLENLASNGPEQDKTDIIDWRRPIIDYLQDPSLKVDRKIRRLAFKFTLVDEELYRRTVDDMLLKCQNSDQSKVAMGEVHEEISGTHQLAPKMKCLQQRGGFRYYNGCEECQRFSNIQLTPAAMMHPIMKPWPFRGWGLYFMGQIPPPSSKGHHFVLVDMDYFTKWTEVVPLKNMTHKEVTEFITEHIIHRFGIPQTLTTDQGTSFISGQVREFIDSYKIRLLNSSPHYAQANDQAESSNMNLIKLIKKKIDDNPRTWHEVLSEALWAHRISWYGTTTVAPFEIVYGQEAVLPIEVNLAAYRLAKQNEGSAVDYRDLMMDNIDEVIDKRLQALKEIEKDKI
jgi:hypothetical protein